MDKKELGKKIRRERKKRGLTQEKVEKGIGLPQKTITRMEAGERIPSTLQLAKLAELFHISVGDFFKDEIVDEDPLVALTHVAPGWEQSVHLCKEGIFLEKLLEQPEKIALLQHELRNYVFHLYCGRLGTLIFCICLFPFDFAFALASWQEDCFELHASSNEKIQGIKSKFQADRSIVIEAYRQEKISRGRAIELGKLLNLPPQDIIRLAQI